MRKNLNDSGTMFISAEGLGGIRQGWGGDIGAEGYVDINVEGHGGMSTETIIGAEGTRD